MSEDVYYAIGLNHKVSPTTGVNVASAFLYDNGFKKVESLDQVTGEILLARCSRNVIDARIISNITPNNTNMCHEEESVLTYDELGRAKLRVDVNKLVFLESANIQSLRSDNFGHTNKLCQRDLEYNWCSIEGVLYSRR